MKGKNLSFSKTLPLYTIINHYAVFENIYGEFSYSLKIIAKNILLSLNLTVLLNVWIGSNMFPMDLANVVWIGILGLKAECTKYYKNLVSLEGIVLASFLL